MSRSRVYLVSCQPVDKPNMEKVPYNNQGFESQEGTVTYSSPDGIGVQIEEKKPKPDRPYRGMGKEELLHFSSQPFWRRLRMIFIAFIFLTWVALVITVLALVLAYPKCRDPAHRSWWQNEAIYRIYVPSFKDSDDNGVGDLKGVESKLDYIQELGYGVVSLSPIYPTSEIDFPTGNDLAIINHTDVHVKYGTLADFDNLITAAHAKGMYVVLDFIPGVTSNQHQWFKDSVNNNNDRKNFYVWTATPNNWVGLHNGSAWTSDSNRNESYLHHFTADLPDLNLRSALVQDQLEGVLNFWLDRGVDGFNIRHASYLYTDYDLRNQPLKSGRLSGSTNYDDYEPIYTRDLSEVYSQLERWRKHVQAHNNTSTEKLLVTSIDGDLDVTHLYGDCARTGIQLPLNSAFTQKQGSCGGACFTQYVDSWLSMVPADKWANWQSGDETSTRFASRFSTNYISAYTTATMLLPGTPIGYYGDELYLPDVGVRDDPERQARMRPLMRWDNSSNGGFCNNTCVPWRDAITDWSVATAKEGSSLTSLLKDLSSLRREPSFRVGDYFPAIRDDAIFSFVREFDGETGYLVAVNFGNITVSRNFIGSHDTVPEEAVVAMSHGNSYAVEDEVNPGSLELGPYGALVISWDYVAKEL